MPTHHACHHHIMIILMTSWSFSWPHNIKIQKIITYQQNIATLCTSTAPHRFEWIQRAPTGVQHACNAPRNALTEAKQCVPVSSQSCRPRSHERRPSIQMYYNLSVHGAQKRLEMRLTILWCTSCHHLSLPQRLSLRAIAAHLQNTAAATHIYMYNHVHTKRKCALLNWFYYSKSKTLIGSLCFIYLQNTDHCSTVTLHRIFT